MGFLLRIWYSVFLDLQMFRSLEEWQWRKTWQYLLPATNRHDITKCLAKHGYPLQISVPVWSYCWANARCTTRCTDGRQGDGVHYQANYHISRAAVHLRSRYRDGRDATVLREKYKRASLNARSNRTGSFFMTPEKIVLFIENLAIEVYK